MGETYGMMDGVSHEGPSDTEFLYSSCSRDVVERGNAQVLPRIVLRTIRTTLGRYVIIILLCLLGHVSPTGFKPASALKFW